MVTGQSCASRRLIFFRGKGRLKKGRENGVGETSMKALHIALLGNSWAIVV